MAPSATNFGDGRTAAFPCGKGEDSAGERGDSKDPIDASGAFASPLGRARFSAINQVPPPPAPEATHAGTRQQLPKRDPNVRFDPNVENVKESHTMKRAIRRFIASVRERSGAKERPLPNWRREQAGFDIAGSASGATIYGDVALRLKSLTVEELDSFRDDPGANPGAFKIRIARSPKLHRDATILVEDRYTWRGLLPPRSHVDPNLLTFVAYDEGTLVGTVGIRLDSPDGLAADGLYPDEINAVRAGGYRVCEFTRLAVDASSVSKPVLAALFQTAYLFAYRLRHFNIAVIEVNPRHVAYYKRALGFDILGPERHNARVDAPAVLMCTPFESIAENLKRYAGRAPEEVKSRSLFVYGFTPSEEAGILARLRALEERQEIEFFHGR